MKKQIKILFVLQPVSEVEYGGADMHVLELCVFLKENSIYEPVVLLRKNYRLYQRFISSGLECYCGSAKKGTLKYISWANSMLKGFSFSLIHSHGYEANYYTILLRKLYRKWAQIPLVITSHGWIETNVWLRLKTWVDFLCLRKAKGLIVCSEKNLQRIKRFQKNRVIAYIPNGINSQRHLLSFEKIDDKITELKKCNNLRVGFIGRLSAEKRPDLFVSLASKLISMGTDACFFIIGDGLERKNLETTINILKIEEKIKLLGLIENIDEVYKYIDILVVPSDTESTPRVVLEAMWNEIPVIASDVGGVGNIIMHGENGYLFPKGNLEYLENQIVELMSNSDLRKEMGIKGKQSVANNFTIEIMSQKTISIYEKVTHL